MFFPQNIRLDFHTKTSLPLVTISLPVAHSSAWWGSSRILFIFSFSSACPLQMLNIILVTLFLLCDARNKSFNDLLYRSRRFIIHSTIRLLSTLLFNYNTSLIILQLFLMIYPIRYSFEFLLLSKVSFSSFPIPFHNKICPRNV